VLFRDKRTSSTVTIEGPQVSIASMKVGTNNKREGPPLRQRSLNGHSL